MRDEKSGLALSMALLWALLLTAATTIFLSHQSEGAMVDLCAVPLLIAAGVLGYRCELKKSVPITAGLFAALAAVTLIFWQDRAMMLIFWGVMLFATAVCAYNLRVGVRGLISERDYYRAECARISMTDAVTQMRSLHAYLNDAPIYIKIAKRYQLTLAVLVVRIVNAAELRDTLERVIYNELLEETSRNLRACMRLEDLAYFVDEPACVWCINMFTKPEAFPVILERLRSKLGQIVAHVGRDEDVPKPVFKFGYAVYVEQEDLTPSALLERAKSVAANDTV